MPDAIYFIIITKCLKTACIGKIVRYTAYLIRLHQILTCLST